ncbi:ParB N-terminal domain-containing protein (plasmid) [Saccharopolyspora sp. ID03-671]|uniref:ParB/RepB/Spo0J family partition protein n=1 Tax=Saccharopolyspora sp. ID03-671 TaxID=3073066 RepID=UPI0030F45A28
MARVVLGGDDDESDIAVIPSTALPEDIPLHKMQPNPENPRPTDLEVDETKEDLQARGQLQNLNVMSKAAFLDRKPYLADQLGSEPVVVINGCRRLAAAKAGGLKALSGRYRDDWTEDQIDEAMITENVHRKQLNPLLLGRHLKRMASRYGSQRKLAKGINKDPAWVRQRIALTDLHPDLQEAIEAERIMFKVARECSRLHPDLQPLLASGELPESVAQQWLTEERIRQDEQLARWKAGPPYVASDEPAHRPATGDGESEYPVLTPEVQEAAAGTVGTEPSELGDAQGEYPVLTEPKAPAGQPRERSARQPQLIIRVEERSPTALAEALREHLTAHEVKELIEALAR